MSVIRVDNTDKIEFDRALEELRGYFAVLSQSKGHPATYSLLTYGCQLNESDSEKLAGMLSEMGLVKSDESGELAPADVVVMNTCSVRENADRHLFGNLGVFKNFCKKGETSVIAVCGCMMKVPENVEKIQSFGSYNVRLQQFLHILHRSLCKRKRAFKELRRDNERARRPCCKGLQGGHAPRAERKFLRKGQ